jgi:serine/threonine-protein kinase
MDNLIGKTLGQYQIIELAGKGGMATVYKAFQPSLNRYIALKVLPDYLANDEQFVQRFEQEARAAAALRHPNIMVVYDVGQEGNTHYIAAEYLEGATLSQVLAQSRGPLPLPRIVNLLNQLASALDFAHQRGLVHRDIKPSNVFIGPDDHVTLMDFGIVKALTSGQQVTRTGMMVGTPEYMSPEQAEAKSVDQRSDIYSLGVVLYQLLTGRVPFQADSPTAVLLAHVTQPPRPPSQINPAIPPSVEAVVIRALAKNPIERFGSAGELARALVQAAGAPVPQVPVRAPAVPPTVTAPSTPPPSYAPSGLSQTPPPAPPTPRKTNWLLVGGIGLGAIAVLCVVSIVFCGALGFLGGSGTPTPTSPSVALASPTQPAARLTPTEPPAVRTTVTPPSSKPSATPVSESGMLFTDDFKSQQASTDKGWLFDKSDNTEYAWSDGKMVITIKKKQWIGWNTPGGTFDDFGAEVEAQAMGSDYAEYGLIFRISGSGDNRSYYTFAVTTNGKYYLQKRVDGQWADTDPVSPTASAAVKTGNNKNVLRVLARGDKITLYVNGTLINTVKDDSVASGKIGAFAATGSDNTNAQVSFTRFTVLSPDKAIAEWGATGGAMLYKDDFSKPDSGWSVDESDNTAKYYKDGKYFVNIKNSGYTGWGVPESEYFSGGVVIDVDATFTDGPTENDFGIVCHLQDDENFYYLAISSDGSAGIMKESGGSGFEVVSGEGQMLASPAIKKGKGVTNHMQAICDAGRLTLMVNGTKVAEVQDDEFEEGNVGLAASALKTSGGGVIVGFDNLVVGEIP